MKKAARILIISSGHPCRNPRPVKEATTLGNAGYEVTLLTPCTNPQLAALDAELTHGARFVHLKIEERPSLVRRLHQWMVRRTVPFGVHSVYALGFPSRLLRAAREEKATLTIVHNELPHWIGTRLLAEGRTVAADFEDWHSEDLLPTDRRHRPLRLLRSTERQLLHEASYVTTTSDALAGALHASYGGTNAATLSNSFPLQPTPIRAALESPASFFWFSQTLGPGRGLEYFLEAWQLTRQPSRLVLLGEPSRGYAAALRTQLSKTFLDRVTFLPLVPPADLPALIAKHDIGLALEDVSIRNRDLTITNKILQYLNAGLAIVASDTAGQREVLARSPTAGLIAPTKNPQAFATMLDELLNDRAGLRNRQHAARRLAEEHYCWEREAPRFLALVEKALS